MKKKSIRKSKPTPQYDSQRETRVLLEQIRSEVKTVAEQYGGVAKKLDKIDNKQQEHDSILFKLEMGLETVKSRVGTIDTKVDRIERELETIKLAIRDVDIRFGEKVTDYEKRLHKLEKTQKLIDKIENRGE